MEKKIRGKMKEVRDSFIKMTGLGEKDVKCKIVVRRGEGPGSELFKQLKSLFPEEMREKTPDFFQPYYSGKGEIHWPEGLDPEKESSSATEEIFHAVWDAYASSLGREPSMFETELSHYIFSAAQGKELPVEVWESKRKRAREITNAFEFYTEILDRLREKDEGLFERVKEGFGLDQAKIHSSVLEALLDRKEELERVDKGDLLKEILFKGCSDSKTFGKILTELKKKQDLEKRHSF